MFNNKSTKNSKSSTPSAPQSQNIFYPISLPFYNYPSTQSQPILTSQSSTVSPSSGNKTIPTIQEFLENLDNLYGSQNRGAIRMNPIYPINYPIKRWIIRIKKNGSSDIRGWAIGLIRLIGLTRLSGYLQINLAKKIFFLLFSFGFVSLISPLVNHSWSFGFVWLDVLYFICLGVF